MTPSLESGVYLFSEFFPGAVAGFSTRVFDAAKDLGSFLKEIGAGEERSFNPKQVHGGRVLAVSCASSSPAPEADGMITRERELALVVRTADCVPLFFYDARIPVVGLTHVGWRGAKEGIVSRTVEMLGRSFQTDPSSLRVAVGPAIRESCYEVGKEFLDYFPGFVRGRGERAFFDLVGFVKSELGKFGVRGEAITDSGLCTHCLSDQFPSARREGPETGRILSVVMLK